MVISQDHQNNSGAPWISNLKPIFTVIGSGEQFKIQNYIYTYIDMISLTSKDEKISTQLKDVT